MPMTESSKAVFLSYASQDAAAAARICEALRAAGIEVWFDQSELRGGDAWDHKIRQQIRDCALFIPVISASSQARLEGYFRREWRLAVERSHDMADSRTFIVPVVIDDTKDKDAEVPESFRAVQWTRLPGGESPAAFCERVKVLLGGGEPKAVSQQNNTHVPDAGALAKTPRHWMNPVCGAVLAALIAGVWVYRMAHPGTAAAPAVASPVVTAPEKSIAVLPFVDMSEKKDQEYFADGMAEELVDVLAKIPGLKVIGRTSSFSFKGHNEDLRTIGAKLGAANIVEGSVRKDGNKLRVTAQLIDARTGTHLWSDSYDSAFGDVLILQDHIASTIARKLQLTVSPGDTVTARRLHNEEAYTLYLKGLLDYDRGPAGWREAQSDLEQALVLDPAFLKAAETLALAYLDEVGVSYVSSEVGWQRARVAAERALRLDPGSAMAHAVLGMMYGTYLYNWQAAEVELTKALAAHSRDPKALNTVSWLAGSLGHFDKSLRLLDASLALDPLNPETWEARGEALASRGDFEPALAAYRRSLEISPTFTLNHFYAGEARLRSNQYAAALAEYLLATPADGRDIGLAMVYHALGRKTESDAALARVRREYGELWPHNIAQACAYRGERDQAFAWLDKAYAERRQGLVYVVRDDRLLNSLHSDPRYKMLLKKMNLPEG